ncbi:DMT family transporter [Pelagibius sp.]|uniref:DMT family transporter n=1 Tax=Pelagibius sp. TaxID=1931238 RepID=UPI0026205E34|nr:DMT family transporter [Pelagibius sp.]
MSAAAEQRPLGLGVALALISAGSFGFIISLARLTYEAGSNPLTVIFFRALVPSLLLLALLALRRHRFAVQPGAFWPMTGVVIGQLGIALCYLSAVAYIPVSLAALVFYAYPLLVALLMVLSGRSAAAWPMVLAFLAAFAGLVLALAPSFAGLDPRGLALAGGSTLSGLLLFLSADRLPGRQDVLAVALYANLVAALIVGPLALALGVFALPASGLGWSCLAGVCLGFLAAFFSMIGAIRYAGALKAALVFNLEPLVAILSAILLLGESLDLTQALGVALVLAALTGFTLAERRQRQSTGT